MSITWRETKKYIGRDIYRNLESFKKTDFIKAFWGSSTVSTLVYYRMCHYYAEKASKNPFDLLIHSLCYLRFSRLKQKCGIELNQHTKIGYGLRLPHKGGIVIHPLATIGNNCEIMQGVTIGNNILKDRDAVARIGDGVLLSAGSKIIGGIRIGNCAIVGANAVVTKDVEDNTIVGGVPAKVIGKSDGRHIINLIG